MSSRAARQSATPRMRVSSISPLPTRNTGSRELAAPRRAARCLLLSIFRLLLYLRNVSILFQECGQPGGQLFHGAAAVADGVLLGVGKFGVAAAGGVGGDGPAGQAHIIGHEQRVVAEAVGPGACKG